MPGKQQTIDEQPQFSVGKLTLQVEVGKNGGFLPQRLAVCPQLLPAVRALYRCAAECFAVLDGIAALQQFREIPADGLPVGSHAVLCFQNFSDLPLGEPVVLIAVLAEDVQNIQNKQFLGLFHIHGHAPLSAGFF